MAAWHYGIVCRYSGRV